ncbi:MAG: hypothetical protein RBU30_05150 [Polyangia bacterium]|jgi:hypothetical protein|nr:hypothetical protein [Polyangia bacterium]
MSAELAETDQLGFVALLDDNQIAAAAILCAGDDHLRVNQEVGTIDDQKTEIIMEYLLDPGSVNEIAGRYDFTAR